MGKPKLGKGLAALTAVPAVLSTKESITSFPYILKTR